MENLLIVLVGLSGLAAASIVVVASATDLRDTLVDMGWMSPSSRLGRMSIRARREVLLRTLNEIGFRSHHFEGVAIVGDQRARARRFGDSTWASCPDRQLISVIKPWIRE